ncbi:hypothetical protein [Paracoccus litorisediminis]|uniref:Uncharacterized protein n=1 Tax=Paracoccus litorisediminis TaxID=2006130 RepID=A0A844HMM9_9RHOB|nr:hypothetical protein [Paracoccus litorisediminis]MTH61126.1 hypothetical protein [Paracoccus litorisediminis]
MTDDWPNHHEELTRKTVQELQKWASRAEAGTITQIMWLSILSVLYDTTSGLIDKEVSDLIADFHRDTINILRKGAAA